MIIKKIEIYKVNLPLHTILKTNFGIIQEKQTIISRLITNEGLAGYGESSALSFPMYNEETIDSCALVIKNYIAPLILNNDISTIEDLNKKLAIIKGNYIAKTSIETAMWMLLSFQENKSLKNLLGGERKKIAVGESIGIKETIDEVLNEVELRLNEGFQRMKIKIQPNWDINVIEKIRNKFPNINLMVDANSAYTLSDLKILRKMDNYKLMMIEQPLGDTDIIDHATLQAHVATPICLDESILSAEDARKAISINACKIINIKPGRVGGLLESKKIHDICKEKGIGVWCGGMMESGIGRAFNIALASLPNFIYPADMSPFTYYFKDDLVKDSFSVDKAGFVDVSEKVGLGFEIDEKKLKKYTIQMESIQ